MRARYALARCCCGEVADNCLVDQASPRLTLTTSFSEPWTSAAGWTSGTIADLAQEVYQIGFSFPPRYIWAADDLAVQSWDNWTHYVDANRTYYQDDNCTSTPLGSVSPTAWTDSGFGLGGSGITFATSPIPYQWYGDPSGTLGSCYSWPPGTPASFDRWAVEGITTRSPPLESFGNLGSRAALVRFVSSATSGLGDNNWPVGRTKIEFLWTLTHGGDPEGDRTAIRSFATSPLPTYRNSVDLEAWEFGIVATSLTAPSVSPTEEDYFFWPLFFTDIEEASIRFPPTSDPFPAGDLWSRVFVGSPFLPRQQIGQWAQGQAFTLKASIVVDRPTSSPIPTFGDVFLEYSGTTYAPYAGLAFSPGTPCQIGWYVIGHRRDGENGDGIVGSVGPLTIRQTTVDQGRTFTHEFTDEFA